MKLLACLALTASLLAPQTRPANVAVTAVRHWTLADVTRIAVEVTGEFEIRSDRLHNPERVYFDILNARPRFGGKRLFQESIEGSLVSRVRVAETQPGVTRVVLDLTGPADISTSHISNPDRLIIELRPGTELPEPPVPTATAASTPPPIKAELPRMEPPPILKSPPKSPPKSDVPSVEQVTAEPSKAQVAKAEPLQARETPVSAAVEKPGPAPVTQREASKAARHTSSGGTSLVRALGLKVGRIVIDPGHGGHDQGTSGPKGLLEKDLVLDVSQRLGKLVEERLGAEVIYTRADDTFVPLEGRTALANEKKADLFLSIHANSSPVPRITGIETYYLNFTNAKDALDLAARENASSQKSVFELRDILQKLALNDKAEESREFASRIQAALYGFSARTFPGTKNRGVRRAPFVVLIGAHMPSVLAEIGFISNPREEALMKRADYRQKVAEALFRGVQKYAEGLSHFQVAQAKDSGKESR